MNNRIKELSKQAGFIHFSPDEDSDTPIDWSCDYTTELEKFAELIIRECMSIIKQGEGLGEEDDFDKGFQAGIAMAYNRVRTQMGVDLKETGRFRSSFTKMQENGYVWKITVGDTYVGVANTEDRLKLLKEAVDNGIIPADYKITDVKMEMIKNEPTN